MSPPHCWSFSPEMPSYWPAGPTSRPFSLLLQMDGGFYVWIFAFVCTKKKTQRGGIDTIAIVLELFLKM